jgi:radical SAM protein
MDRQRPSRFPDFDFDRAPFLVLWEVTRACDLICRHCRAQAQRDGLPGELTTEACFGLLDEIRRFGRPIVVLTGGDPLKRRDIFEIVRYGVERGLKMTMTPSGTPLVARDRIAALKDAGLSRLAVSVDGPTAEIHDAFRGVDGSWGWTMNAIEYANRVGLPVQINTTMSRYNLESLDAMARLMGNLNITLWSVFFLVPTGRGRAKDALSDVESEGVFNRLYDLSRSMPFDIKTTAAPQYRRVVLQRTAMSRSRDGSGAVKPVVGSGRAPAGVTDGRGVVFVSYKGDIYPSGFLPLKAGNVTTDSLVDVYRHAPLFKKLRDTDALTGKCGLCEFKSVCGGSRARAYAIFGDPTAYDPACVYVSSAAREAGLAETSLPQFEVVTEPMLRPASTPISTSERNTTRAS